MAALGLVAVCGRQAHIHVLPRSVPQLGGERRCDALGPCRFGLHGYHLAQLPA
jgi:hypothetical protein